MASNDSDEETLQLPADTLSLLQQFYSEKESRQEAFEELKATAEDDFNTTPLSMEAFTEDWNASQFWYTDATATALAAQLLDGATTDTEIAVVSAPSVFLQLKNLLAKKGAEERPKLTLLEFDERFAVFKEFVRYDFEHPTRLPPEFKGRFSHIIVDPPFLSEDCQTKAALTVRWMAKGWDQCTRVIACTGERMEELILKLYGKVGLRTTDFEIVHAKGLSNEFRCYANFESDIWTFKASE